jgi:hypothetical protein
MTTIKTKSEIKAELESAKRERDNAASAGDWHTFKMVCGRIEALRVQIKRAPKTK